MDIFNKVDTKYNFKHC